MFIHICAISNTFTFVHEIFLLAHECINFRKYLFFVHICMKYMSECNIWEHFFFMHAQNSNLKADIRNKLKRLPIAYHSSTFW
jgi:hypothetical protein